MTDDETWRAILGYEGLYEVSNQGRVRSLERKVARGNGFLTVRGGLMRPSANKLDGRLKVELSLHGRIKSHKVHRLVAIAFLPHPEDPRKINVLHRNGDHLDNQVDNLYWGTQSENMHDKSRHGKHPQRQRTHCPQGHPYDELNTRWYRGMRYCRACPRERKANELA